jgi:hypothetical protein
MTTNFPVFIFLYFLIDKQKYDKQRSHPPIFAVLFSLWFLFRLKWTASTSYYLAFWKWALLNKLELFFQSNYLTYAALLFQKALVVSLIIFEGKNEISDTVISVKSNIQKNEGERVPLIIPLEFQWAYPYCKSVKWLSDSLLTDAFVIWRKEVGLRQIMTNAKEKEKMKLSILLLITSILNTLFITTANSSLNSHIVWLVMSSKIPMISKTRRNMVILMGSFETIEWSN